MPLPQPPAPLSAKMGSDALRCPPSFLQLHSPLLPPPVPSTRSDASRSLIPLSLQRPVPPPHLFPDHLPARSNVFSQSLAPDALSSQVEGSIVQDPLGGRHRPHETCNRPYLIARAMGEEDAIGDRSFESTSVLNDTRGGKGRGGERREGTCKARVSKGGGNRPKGTGGGGRRRGGEPRGRGSRGGDSAHGEACGWD